MHALLLPAPLPLQLRERNLSCAGSTRCTWEMPYASPRTSGVRGPSCKGAWAAMQRVHCEATAVEQGNTYLQVTRWLWRGMDRPGASAHRLAAHLAYYLAVYFIG